MNCWKAKNFEHIKDIFSPLPMAYRSALRWLRYNAKRTNNLNYQENYANFESCIYEFYYQFTITITITYWCIHQVSHMMCVRAVPSACVVFLYQHRLSCLPRSSHEVVSAFAVTGVCETVTHLMSDMLV